MEPAVPKRSAAKIAHLRGTVTLASAGTEKSIELGNLKSPGKRNLDIPASANVTITAEVATGGNEINLEYAGDEDAITSLEVVDSSGHKVSSGMSSFSFGNGPVHRSISLERPVDDSMKLVAKISLDRKLTKVGFDLNDIPLP